MFHSTLINYAGSFLNRSVFGSNDTKSLLRELGVKETDKDKKFVVSHIFHLPTYVTFGLKHDIIEVFSPDKVISSLVSSIYAVNDYRFYQWENPDVILDSMIQTEQEWLKRDEELKKKWKTIRDNMCSYCLFKDLCNDSYPCNKIVYKKEFVNSIQIAELFIIGELVANI